MRVSSAESSLFIYSVWCGGRAGAAQHRGRGDDLECAGRKHKILPDLTPAFQASPPLVPSRSGCTQPRMQSPESWTPGLWVQLVQSLHLSGPQFPWPENKAVGL